MAPMTVPVIPDSGYPAGYIFQNADLVNLSNACTFLLNKPMTKVYDSVGGQSIPQASGTVNINFNTVLYDVDGMYNSSNKGRLTIQTPGWYKLRYAINCGNASGFQTVNCWAQLTTGSNNPLGGGNVSLPMWLGGTTDGLPLWCWAAGIVTSFCYTGDFISIFAQRGTSTSMSTSVSAFAGSNHNGSYMSLEYVSTV